MFRSQAGGACDCGDTNVMKESGFCYLHGPHATSEGHTGCSGNNAAPPDLLCVANAMMPRLILRLIQHMRQNSISLDGFLGAVQAADKFITMLHDLSSMGAAMRQVMTHALTNPNVPTFALNSLGHNNEFYNLPTLFFLSQVYKSSMEFNNEQVSEEYEEFMRSTQRCYDDALGTLRNPLPPSEFEGIYKIL